MKKYHLEKIQSDFFKSDYDKVVSKLESITLTHVMAQSQTNLDNTLSAILQLSKGNINELEKLIDAAKKDFRDVIYWATLENEKLDT
jgi:fructose-1-phosphate kinase PfkB-like protein